MSFKAKLIVIQNHIDDYKSNVSTISLQDL